ncbi:glycosyltransferase family 2 protein [Litorisediminicola beolgyonensis]|uniref:Glycosyltransferase family 2 protein n=1 Tax=Litorisediminicola beolgyonensis TaxID=1173614 RepID=A0ABW3ZE85_9RHOB
MPRASIIVPSYNSAATLPATLASLLAQTAKDFEIVVVDDGSTDSTPDLLQRITDPRLRIVRQANRGLAGARNSGVHAARGTVVGFCDADDLWHPQKLDRHLEHLAARPRIGVSYSGSSLIDAKGRATGHAQRPRLKRVDATHVFLRNPIGNGSAPVFRRSALDAISYLPKGGDTRPWVFDETFRQSEDIECWLRLALTTGWGIEGVPGLLTLYRVNPRGLSANLERQLASWEAMVRKLTPLDPSFFQAHTAAARAYQLRYLARRAVSALDADAAWSYARRALASSLAPLRDEPLKTAVTMAAALALRSGSVEPLRRCSGLFR